MRSLALALMAAALAVTAAKSDETCEAQAREYKFTREQLRTYMANCETVAAMVCDGKAAHQKLAGEERTNFNAKCIKDAVGR
jgi:hypothetical protein